MQALQKFDAYECAHTPHLLAFTCNTLEEGLDPNGMTGGFVAWTLMTRVPGERIRYSDYWRCSSDKRAEIRKAFKKALT